MPESQVSNVLVHQARKALVNDYRNDGLWPEGYLRLFPRTFATGTDTKSYDTISVDSEDFEVELEPTDTSFRMNKHDAARVPSNAPWKYLVDRRLKSGEVYLSVRGKCIVVSAGYHALVCHMSLEGNLRTLTREDFDDLVAHCVPGKNKKKTKAAKMRSFVVPERFIEPGSRGKGGTINVLAAVVTDDRAIALVDYSRMSRVHIVSMSRKFTEADLRPGSKVWSRLWRKFPGGPDWVLEQEEVLAFLDAWKESVLLAGTTTPIIDVLTTADGPGGGIGKQLANDFLFEVAIHPDTPSRFLCAYNELYQRLRGHLPVFMSTWVSADFLELCGGTPNSLNPLAFNTKSDQNFILKYVRVYRRREVRVSAELFDLYQSSGLLDPDHVIGTPYSKTHAPVNKKFKEVRVHRYLNSQVNRYHIIRAAVPPDWTTNPEDSAFQDVSQAGYQTTLGAASFREPMQNKIDVP